MFKTKNKTMQLLGSKNFKMSAGAALVALATVSVVSCGGGGGSGSGSSLPPGIGLVESAAQVTPSGSLDNFRLTEAEVDLILKQGIAVAGSTQGTFAIVDRVGNVLAVYSTDGSYNPPRTTGPFDKSARDITISSGLVPTGTVAGLDNATAAGLGLDRAYFAIAKALTGAYLSSSGNAFSTRTASFIVQEHIPPGSGGVNQPSGPLFGVQFSQLPCGDLVRDLADSGTKGPKRSPLGLSADPGGFPLYKNGVVVGGIGFISAGGTYGLDRQPNADRDNDIEENIAISAARGFTPADTIKSAQIFLGGPTAPYSDVTGTSVTASSGTLVLQTVAGYFDGVLKAGIPYGTDASGYRPIALGSDLGTNMDVQTIGSRLASRRAFILTKTADSTNRYPVTGSSNTADVSDDISDVDVAKILESAYDVAFRGRAQIRSPQGSAIQVTISVVDTSGKVLGVIRTPDAPIFGTDVSLQKARTAMVMSKNITGLANPIINNYISKNATNIFTPVSRFDGFYAFSDRALGNYARPLFPDGIDNTAPGGPFAPSTNWSPFNTGLQLDLVAAQVLNSAATTVSRGAEAARTCTTNNLPAQNGLQIFPGGFPIYKGDVLVGGIGISGDGVDQDDMIAFLGLQNSGASVGNAPRAKRVDQYNPGGSAATQNAVYVSCPFQAFNDGSANPVCN